MSEGQTAAPVPDSHEQQSPASQVAGLPLFRSAYDMVASALASAKETHSSIKHVCEAAEKGVTAIGGAAVTGTSLALTATEPQLPDANEVSCQSLEILEEKLSIQEPAEQDLLDTKEVDAKDAVNSRMTEVVDVTQETLQGSVGTVKLAMISTAMDPTLGQTASREVETVLGEVEDLMDGCLSITDEKLATLPGSVEGAEGPAVQHQGCFVQLGSLSAQLHQRAYPQALGKVRQAKQGLQESFHEVLDLNVDWKLQDSQRKLHHMWLEWSNELSEGSGGASSLEPEQVESHTLAMSQSITQQLQDTCRSLKASIQGLPTSIQDKVQQVLQNLEELRGSFFAAKSFQDLPSASQSQEKISKDQGYVDELLEYLEHNPFLLARRTFHPIWQILCNTEGRGDPEENRLGTMFILVPSKVFIH